MPDRDFHIAIVGGGIGGLALAVALTRYDISFTLYEAAPQFGTVGAGVGLGPNALRAMDAVVPGFQEMYDRISSGNVTPGKDHVMMDAMYIEEGFGERKGWKPVSYGAPCYNRTSAHRKDLLDILIAGVPPEKVQFRKRATGFRQHRGGPDGEEGVTISFEDGTESRVDAVIGADGVKGLSRAAVLGERWPELVPARYTGRYVYRSVVPMDAATAILGQDCLGNDIAGDARMFMGPRAIITIFPISKGTQCNLVCFILVGDQPWTHPEWTQTVSKEEMRKDLREAGIDHRLVQMLDWSNPPVRWAIHDHPVTPTYFSSRICLLGDSAHATTPHQAAGAGQCLEDALVLSRVLAGATKASDLPLAFAAYDQVRRPRAQRVVQTSREAGDVFAFRAPGIGDDMQAIVENMNERFLWIWEHDIVADAEAAATSFAEAVGKKVAAESDVESVKLSSKEPAGTLRRPEAPETSETLFSRAAIFLRGVLKWLRSLF